MKTLYVSVYMTYLAVPLDHYVVRMPVGNP